MDIAVRTLEYKGLGGHPNPTIDRHRKPRH
jgi:hypothetical protein